MNSINIELNEATLRKLVKDYLQNKLGCVNIFDSQIKIQVKSKQNYKAEWEEAAFRVMINIGLEED